MEKEFCDELTQTVEYLRGLNLYQRLPHDEIRATVSADILEEASRRHPGLKREKAARRLERLFREIERKRAKAAGLLTDKIQRARLDVLIFLSLAEDGWGKTVRYPSGAVVAVDSPVSGFRRLGYPSRARLVEASRRVHQACPEEAVKYRETLKQWREACRRYGATETEKGWKWYACGSGNRRSLAYRSEVALRHRGGVEAYRKQHRYLYGELLPREQERQRARREMSAAENTLERVRGRLFEALGVPKPLRDLA